jgi:hypothetical protein
MRKPARFLLFSIISISASFDHPHTLHTMGSTGDVEMAELRQPTLHTGARTTRRLHRSRSLPEVLHFDRNLQSTHVAHEAQAPTLPSNVPASTEAVEIDQDGQLTTAAKTTELHGYTQLPVLSNSNSDPQNTPPTPSPADLGPPTVVSVSEGTDYDYLEQVKEICDGIKPDLYDLFEKHFQEGHGEVFLISKEHRKRILPPSSDGQNGLWVNLKSQFFLRYGIPDSLPEPEPFPHFGNGATIDFSILRNLVTSATEEDPHVLIVEGSDRTGVQILGMLFNIDPRFVAQHLGTFETRNNMFRQNAWGVLSDKFKSFMKERNEMPGHAEGNVDMASKPSPSYTMDGRLYTSIRTDRAEALDIWPGSVTGRIDGKSKSVILCPRASCYQVSPYGCKVHFICLGYLPIADISPS